MQRGLPPQHSTELGKKGEKGEKGAQGGEAWRCPWGDVVLRGGIHAPRLGAPGS